MTLPTAAFDDDEDGQPHRSRAPYFAVATVVVIGAGLAIAWAASGGRSNPKTGSDTSTASPSGGESWWTPPTDTKQTKIEALAYAIATIDEDTLGHFFDKDLQPIHRAGSFFEEHEPKRMLRDEMSHAYVQLDNRLQLRAGFNVLIARAGGSYSQDRAYKLYRAMQIREVVFVDESKRMHTPPENAVFYLAEIYRGHAFDMLVEGDHREIGADVDLKVKVPVNAGGVYKRDKYKFTVQGLGLAPIGGEAIFVTTDEEIRQHYRTTGEPVIVKLVFRTIPGRSVKKRDLPKPRVIVDETWTVAEGDRKEIAISTGRFRVAIASKPKGMLIRFTGDATCDPPFPKGEDDEMDTTCTVTRSGQLLISNYHHLWNGPSERMAVYVAKLPD